MLIRKSEFRVNQQQELVPISNYIEKNMMMIKMNNISAYNKLEFQQTETEKWTIHDTIKFDRWEQESGLMLIVTREK